MTVGIVASAHVESASSGGVPATLPNLVLWLDGDDDASFTFSSGVVVSQWNDKSGGGRHVTQATVGNRPDRSGTLNSRDVVVFTKANGDHLRWTGSNAISGTTLTAFVVAYVDGSPGSGDRTLGVNQTGTADWNGVTGAVVVNVDLGKYPGCYRNASKSNSGSLLNNQWLLITSLFDGTNHTMFTGATGYTPVASTGTFDVDAFNIACNDTGGENGNVRIAEIIIYSDAKGSTDRTTIRDYLTTKWGV